MRWQAAANAGYAMWLFSALFLLLVVGAVIEASLILADLEPSSERYQQFLGYRRYALTCLPVALFCVGVAIWLTRRGRRAAEDNASGQDGPRP